MSYMISKPVIPSSLKIFGLALSYYIMKCGVLPNYNIYTKANNILPVDWSLCLRILVPRSFCRIECSSIITALMFILSLGNSTEQAAPISKIKTKHSWILTLPFWRSLQVMLFICVSPSLSRRRMGSIMPSIICSDKATLTKSQRFKLSWKMSLVGLFHVNISNNNIP